MSILTAVARGDTRVMILIQNLDAAARPLIIPALAVTGASLDMRGDEAAALIQGPGRLRNVMCAPLADARQAVRLADVISRTGLDPWDAHVAAVADVAVCAILTANAAKWQPHLGDLDEPLVIVELADPDEN
jgi:hypothetical protein